MGRVRSCAVARLSFKEAGASRTQRERDTAARASREIDGRSFPRIFFRVCVFTARGSSSTHPKRKEESPSQAQEGAESHSARPRFPAVTRTRARAPQVTPEAGGGPTHAQPGGCCSEPPEPSEERKRPALYRATAAAAATNASAAVRAGAAAELATAAAGMAPAAVALGPLADGPAITLAELVYSHEIFSISRSGVVRSWICGLLKRGGRRGGGRGKQRERERERGKKG